MDRQNAETNYSRCHMQYVIFGTENLYSSLTPHVCVTSEHSGGYYL